MSTVYDTNGSRMTPSRIIVQLISPENQTHITKSKTWLKVPSKITPNVPLQNQKPVW